MGVFAHSGLIQPARFDEPPDAPWIVAGTREAIRAGAALRAAGLSAFVPVEQVADRRGRSRARMMRWRAVWPGYVFLQARHGAALRALRGVRFSSGPPALTGFLGPEGVPLPVPLREIEALRRACAAEGFDLRGWAAERADAPPVEGARARIVWGPFAGRRGLVARLRGDEARVLCEMFGALVPVTVPRVDLEGADDD